MKLRDNLYKVESVTELQADTRYGISLNPEHFIYKAHFPGEPITPGVVILQIACELMEDMTGTALEPSVIRNAKFLKIISPIENSSLTFDFSGTEAAEDGLVCSQVKVVSDDVIFAKFSIQCRKKA